VAQILFLGAWIAGLAFIAYTFIQSQGRPDLTGKLHFAELIPFLAILWLLITAFGIKGAAAAWTLRSFVDAFLMFWAAGFSRREVVAAVARPTALLCGSGILARFIGSSLATSLPAAILVGLVSVGLAYAFSEDLRRILTVQFVRARSVGEGLIRRVKPAQSA
jgi:O-antigen/teichoic acid export membrane protein